MCVCVYDFLVDSFMLLRVFGSFAYGTRKEMRKVSLVDAELRKVELSSVRPRSFSLTCVDCIEECAVVYLGMSEVPGRKK